MMSNNIGAFAAVRIASGSASRMRRRGGGGGGGGSGPEEDDRFDRNFAILIGVLGSVVLLLISLVFAFAYWDARRHDGHPGHFESRQAYKYQSKQERRENRPKELYTYQQWVCDQCKD